MITLRKEQFAAFQEAATEQYLTDVAARLGGRYPRLLARAGDAALKGMAREGLARAREWGVTGKRDVEEFLDFMVRYGRSFPRGTPWAEAVLNDPDSDGATKMTRLELHELWHPEA